MSRITENDMVTKTNLGDGTQLAEGSSAHHSYSYHFRIENGRLRIENGCFVAEVASENENFVSLQKKRKKGGNVDFEHQLGHQGDIDVPNVWTSAALFET